MSSDKGADIVNLGDVRSGATPVTTAGQRAEAAAAKAQAEMTAKAEEIIAAEDTSRQYSPLVRGIKAKYDAQMLTEGMFLDVYASVSAHNSIAVYQVNEANKGQVEIGELIVSLDLSKPFSEQWPEDLDGMDAKAAFDIAPKGMCATGSAFMRHMEKFAGKASEPAPTPGDHRGIALG